MAKNTNDEYDIRIEGIGAIKLTGDIKNISEKHILLRHRRSGSSKYQIKPIPLSDIIYISGEIGLGKSCEILYRDSKALYKRIRKGNVESNIDSKTGLMTCSDDNGVPIYININNLNAVTKNEIEAPEPSDKNDKKKKSNKPEKKKK